MTLRLASQAALLTFSRAAGQLMNAVVAFVLARVLSQDDFGTFRQIYLLFVSLFVLTDLGLTESLYYFLPRMPERRAKFFLRAVAVVSALQFAAAGILVAFQEAIGRFFNNPDLPQYLALVAVYIGLSTITRLWEVQLIAEQRALGAAILIGVSEFVKMALLLAAVVFAPGLPALVWALVASAGLRFLAFLWYLGGQYRWSLTLAAGTEWGEQFSYSMALWLPGILAVATTYAHQYIVGFSFSPAEYAVYSVACFQVPFLGVLTNSLIEVMLVRITAARAQGRDDEVRAVWASATLKSQLVFIPMAAGLAVLAGPLITLLFTPTYRAAAPLFAILMIALPLNGILTNNVLRAYGAMRDYAKFYAAKLALGLGLGIAGVVWFGMWGAAVSSVLAVYIVTGWQLARVAGLLRVSWRGVLPWRALGKIAAASLGAALPAGACAVFLPSPALALAAGLPLFTGVCSALLIKFNLLTWSDVVSPLQELARFLRESAAQSIATGAVEREERG